MEGKIITIDALGPIGVRVESPFGPIQVSSIHFQLIRPRLLSGHQW